METGMARQQETSTHLQKQNASHESDIRKMLMRLAERRQAQVTPGTLLIFSQDLAAYSLKEIDQALTGIASVPRREGETAFPEIAVIVESIRAVKRVRSERSAIDVQNARIEHFKSHPELYSTSAEVEELTKTLNEKFGMGRKKEIPLPQYNEVRCPHCDELLPLATNMRLWTAEEMRTVADTLEELAVIADRNRNMPKLPLGDAVEESHG